MKSLSIDGTKLNFIDIHPEKSHTLLFLHGNSHSLKSFSAQMNADELKDYRLVLLDLPGHGDSSKDGHYSLKNFAQLIAQFIKTLNLKNIIVIGHSMGGHVAINLLKHYEPAGLFIFGTPPLNNPFDPNAFLANSNATALGQMESTKEEIEAVMAEMDYTGAILDLGVEDYLRTDPNFRSDIFGDIIAGIHENEIALINSFPRPIIFLLATTERLINNNYIRNEFSAKNATVTKELLEIESGHSPQVTAALEFNKILANFAKKVFENSLTNTNLYNGLQHESSYEQRD